MTSLTQNPKPKTKKFLFHCWLQDLPSLLRVWTALYHNWWQYFACAKTDANCWI